MDGFNNDTPPDASSRASDDVTREMAINAEKITAFAANAAPTPALAAPNGEKCPSCGSGLATDQRYCLECGERRGEPRLPFMDGRPQVTATAPVPATSAGPKSGGGLTLLASIGVLLLALGVGVLIGHSGNKATAAQAPAPVQILGAAASTAATGATSSTGSTGATSNTASTAAAKKTVLPPATVKLGQKGTGRGFTNGKFTGDFFK